ncbi:MAG: hypothetical protein EOP48_32450 [Sphingobacteriales bacterium]|nr:MAG: hypothetical protein EOP48_32450 [Sphingobacteriales bacterium]
MPSSAREITLRTRSMSKKSRRKVKKKSKKELLNDRLMTPTVAILAVAAFLFGFYMFVSRFPGPNVVPSDDVRLIGSNSPRDGNSNAEVTIVEFLDLASSSCVQADFMLKEIMERYQGKVQLLVRHLPLEQNSLFAAKAMESAAKQGLSNEMKYILLTHQEEWKNEGGNVRAYFVQRATDIGLNIPQFDADLESPTVSGRIEQDKKDAANLGVRTAPTFFVNGRKVQHATKRHISQMINRLLDDG